MKREIVRDAVLPLRLVFWGGLICVLDFKINNFDLLNDVVGIILIAVGVFRLSAITVSERYTSWMGYVKIVAAVSVAETLYLQLPISTPGPISALLQLLGIAQLACIIVFCMAMRLFSEVCKLEQAKSSWRTSTILFACIYAVPLGLLYLTAFVAVVAGESFHLDLGIGGLLLIPVFFIPLIHLFISTSCMKNEAFAS